MNKAHSRVNWENYPSDSTPLNEHNLNKMDVSIDEIDNRVISLDTTKLDKVTAATMVKDVFYDESTGIFTVKYLNGATYILDTKLEKLAVNFSYNATIQQLIITLDDGTIQYVDLAALITQYEFLDTDTVAFYVDSAGKVSAIVKDGSITEDKLQPNYLADIKIEVSKAQNSATAAATSEKNAKASETAAKESETNAKASETAAKTSETNAKTSETAAKTSETNAAKSETNAKTSEENAKTSETNAASSETATEKSATNASKSETAAANSATSAETSADLAKSYAVGTDGEVRENDGTDNAKYYYEQAKHISQGMNGLTPMGTVTFEDLPTSDIVKNAMYNISNAFTSDDRFLDGGGIVYGAGNNVYYTADGKWDVLASSAVTGVKGNKETTYRQGNVNITPDNIGALPIDGDSKDNTVTFTQNTDLENIASGERHKTLFGKISKAISTLISHINTKAITGIQNTHPLGHVRVYDEMEETSVTGDCSVPSLALFQDEISALNTNLVTHKSSSDHDGRYYTESEINNLLSQKQDASTAINNGNIALQSVNYASSSGAANTAVYGVDDNTGHDTDFFMSRSSTAGYRLNNSCFFDRNGIYCTGPDTEYASDWGVILTLKAPGADWMFQVWFKTRGDIFVRRSINTGAHSFTAWKQVSVAT